MTFKPSKYSNYELKLHKYFYDKTQGIDPSHIFNIKVKDHNFIFFFINKENYFKARAYIKSIRNDIKNKKISIIRTNNILVDLIFNLFPDLCIYDIKIEINNLTGRYEISIYFLKELNTYQIAVGSGGRYIKALNILFEKYINFGNKDTPLELKCLQISSNNLLNSAMSQQSSS
ncbi:MAG: hypothetical protein JSV23_07240 [Promethearchaeota archaeon]|nr:MAG: hypothetical protein JSV23_07240 [Candidatus Lokiarchaeota archaeon]